MTVSLYITPETPIEADPAAPTRGPRPFRRFLVCFAIFPVIAYLAAFPLVRSAAYERWDRSVWGPLLDFAFNAGHQNADVVIFGDSTASVGLDPRIINAQLGIKTLVLPGTVGSLPVTGDLALQRYLAANTPPRLLVFYFSPWNLDYTHPKEPHLFEGEEMVFRHAGWPEIAAFVRHHTSETLVFPFRLYSTFGPSMLRALIHREDRERDIAGAFGHVVDKSDPIPSITDPCTLPAKLLAEKSEAPVEALVRKYMPTTQVMVYLAPIPDCRNASALLTRSFVSLHAAPPVALPARSFLQDTYYAHIEPPFVPTSSSLFAEALRKRLALPSPSRSTGTASAAPMDSLH